MKGEGQGVAAESSLQGTEEAMSTLSLTWRYCIQEAGQADSASNVCDLQWNISVVDTLGPSWLSRIERFPNSEVDLYTALCVWDSRHCPH